MAEYRANPDLYGPGGGEYVDDMGQIWPDPWGTLAPEQAAGQVPGPNAGDPKQGALGGGGFQLDPSQAAMTSASPENTPQAPLPPAPPKPAAPPAMPGFAATAEHPGIQTFKGSGPSIPQPSPGFANRPSGAPPAPQPGFANAVVPTSSTSTESGSTGLSNAAAARQGENLTQVAAAKSKAADTAFQQNTLEATQTGNQAQRMLAQASEGLQKTAAEIAVKDHVQNEVTRRMRAASDWRPDRTELFHGDTGAAFGIFAAVAAMAGAYMQGRGLTGQNPYLPTILQIIDDNATDQVRRNSATIQFLKDQKGDLKAAMIELKQRQLQYAQQRLDALALKDKSDLLQAGATATRDAMQAQNMQWEQEKRQALERTVTNKTTRTLAERPNPSAGQQNAAARDELNTIRTGRRILDEWDKAAAGETANKVLGWQSKLGVNWLQETFGGLPKEQQEFINSLRDYEMFTRDLMRREPNGDAGQALSQIGIPKNDRDLAVARERLRAILNDREKAFAGAPSPKDDPTVGAY